MDLELGGSARIRKFRAEDAEGVQRYANNRKIWLNVRDIFPHPYTLEDARGFIAFVAGQKPLTTFAIATEAEAIGCIGLRLGEDVHRKTAELGYWLGEPFWGRGIMTAAIAAFTDWAFANIDLERIYSEPFADNTASTRALEKAGFTREARLRANVFKDGKVLDSMIYARLRAA
jgi:RimJ/RimL family protein N-acetyltransferase